MVEGEGETPSEAVAEGAVEGDSSKGCMEPAASKRARVAAGEAVAKEAAEETGEAAEEQLREEHVVALAGGVGAASEMLSRVQCVPVSRVQPMYVSMDGVEVVAMAEGESGEGEGGGSSGGDVEMRRVDEQPPAFHLGGAVLGGGEGAASSSTNDGAGGVGGRTKKGKRGKQPSRAVRRARASENKRGDQQDGQPHGSLPSASGPSP